MNGLANPFRKSIKKTAKLNEKMPHVNIKITIEKANTIFAQTPFSLTGDIRRKHTGRILGENSVR